MSVLVNICKYVDFRQTFPKISILVKILKKYQFWRKSNFVKFVEKSRFWSKLSKILDFYCDLKNISILAKIYKNLEFG